MLFHGRSGEVCSRGYNDSLNIPLSDLATTKNEHTHTHMQKKERVSQLLAKTTLLLRYALQGSCDNMLLREFLEISGKCFIGGPRKGSSFERRSEGRISGESSRP